jgi:serine/threonine protein kinase
MINQVYLQ